MSTPSSSEKKELPEKMEPPTLLGMDSYVTGEEIGNGAFSVVKEGISRKNAMRVAIKIMPKNKENSEVYISNEKLQGKLNHDNVVELIESFEDEDHAFFVMQFVSSGTLEDYVKKNTLTRAEVWHYFKQIAKGLEHIHSKNVVHRDVKPNNMLLTSNRKLLLTDFGSCQEISLFGDAVTHHKSGTFLFFSPQMALGEKSSGIKADVWAAGVCLYFMLTNGKYPFYDDNKLRLLKTIDKGEIVIPESVEPEEVELKKLLEGVFAKEEKDRMNATDILNCAWIKNGKKLYEEEIAKLNAKKPLVDRWRTFSILPYLEKEEKEEKEKKEKEKAMEAQKEKDSGE